MQSPGKSMSPWCRDPCSSTACRLRAQQGLLKGGRQLLLPLPSLKGGQRDREGGKKPRCRGESLVPLLVYSGILMKRRVSSSLIYHIM